MQGADLTPPVYYWQDSGTGVRLMRGQLLVMIDVRSFYILGFVLIDSPEKRGVIVQRNKFGISSRRFTILWPAEARIKVVAKLH